MNASSQQREHFQQLLNRIRIDVEKLKEVNNRLKGENAQLKSEVDELKKEQTDAFSSISESERIAMRHQLDGLIAKIDRRLNDQ